MDYVLRDLFGNEVLVGMFDWLAMLNFARSNGWKPRGTKPPQWWQSVDVDPGYATNSGQYVTYEDAIAFGRALKRGMEGLRDTIGDPAINFITRSPSEELDFDRVKSELKSDAAICYIEGEGVAAGSLSGDWYFSGRGKHKLEKVIDLCKNSGFLIQSEGLCGLNAWETNSSADDPFEED